MGVSTCLLDSSRITAVLTSCLLSLHDRRDIVFFTSELRTGHGILRFLQMVLAEIW